MTTGERLREIRLSRGLTQREVGERCGIAEPTIRRYELGKLNPKYETLERIAAALDVSTDQLMGTYTKAREQRIPKDNPNDRYPYLLGKQLDGTITAEEVEELDLLQRLNRIAGYLDRTTREGQEKIEESAEIIAGNPKYQKNKTPPEVG